MPSTTVRTCPHNDASSNVDSAVGTISRWGCGNDKGLFCKLHHCVAADTAVSGHLFAALDDKTGEVVGAITFYEPGKTIFEEYVA